MRTQKKKVFVAYSYIISRYNCLFANVKLVINLTWDDVNDVNGSKLVFFNMSNRTYPSSR